METPLKENFKAMKYSVACLLVLFTAVVAYTDSIVTIMLFHILTFSAAIVFLNQAYSMGTNLATKNMKKEVDRNTDHFTGEVKNLRNQIQNYKLIITNHNYEMDMLRKDLHKEDKYHKANKYLEAYNHLARFKDAHRQLTEYWSGDITTEIDKDLCEGYPYLPSFDNMYDDTVGWIDPLLKKFEHKYLCDKSIPVVIKPEKSWYDSMSTDEKNKIDYPREYLLVKNGIKNAAALGADAFDYHIATMLLKERQFHVVQESGIHLSSNIMVHARPLIKDPNEYEA